MLDKLTSLQLQIIVYGGIYMSLAFKWHIKHRHRLRIEGEKNYFCERFIALCDITKALFVSHYKPTLGS